MLKLHVFPPSPRAFKVLCVGEHLQLDYELCFVDLAKGDHRTPAFTALNPNMRMPALEDNGFTLWESNAIMEYLAATHPEKGLLPLDERKRADVARWQFWDATSWDPACATLIFERFVKGFFGGGGPDPVEVEKGLKRFNTSAQVLDAHLQTRKFVCGETLTIADFGIASALIMAEPAQLPLENYGAIKRWFGELSSLPSWQKTVQLVQKYTPGARPTA